PVKSATRFGADPPSHGMLRQHAGADRNLVDKSTGERPQDLRDDVARKEPDIVDREAHHAPPRVDQRVLPPAILLEGVTTRVPFAAVDLDDEPLSGPGEIGESDQTGVFDPVLRYRRGQ